jgi:hypothetical protein
MLDPGHKQGRTFARRARQEARGKRDDADYGVGEDAGVEVQPVARHIGGWRTG